MATPPTSMELLTVIFHRIRRGVIAGVLALSAGIFASTATAQTGAIPVSTSGTIVEKLSSFEDGRFSTFLGLLQAAGLTDELNSFGREVSVFPPNNAAFSALGQDTLNDLLANPDLLRNILRYHIVNDRLSEGTICDRAIAAGGMYSVTAENGDPIVISCNTARELKINGNNVIPPEYIVGRRDGFIHEIDGVLLPPTDNQPPVAGDDTFGPFDAGTAGSLAVLTNDNDPDGQLVDGSIVIVSGPSNGTATPQSDGTVVYQHNGAPGTGSDTFTYTVMDDDGATSNVATVTISPIVDPTPNVPPVAVVDSFTVPAGSTTPLNVLENDTDTDGSVNPDTLVIFGQPLNGSAVVENGQIVYTNDPASSQTFDFIVYQVSDDDGAPSNISYAIINIEAGNVPPVAGDDSFGPFDQGTTEFLNVLGNDNDVDGIVDQGSIVIVTQPGAGTATVQGNQIVYANDPASDATTDTFTYTINDDDGATSAPATVTITLNSGNTPPVAVDDTFGPVPSGTLQILDVVANDTDAEDGQPDASTIQIVSNPVNGGGAFVTDGRISFAAAPGTTSDTFTYTVRDSNGALSNVATVTVTIEDGNIPPVANNDSSDPLTLGGSTTINVVANDTDVDGTVDPATVVITQAPANGTATPQPDGTVVYQNDGTPGVTSDSFTYVVRDDDGAESAPATVTISPIDDGSLPNIVELLIADGNYTTLVDLVVLTGLADTLANEEDNFTVFAPADDVFAALGQDTINQLVADPDTLRDLLLYHVIGGQALDRDALCATAGTPIGTAVGDTVVINCTDIDTFVNNSEVVVANLQASNGFVHGIAPILTRPDPNPALNLYEVVAQDDQFSTLEDLLIAVGLDTTLSDLGTQYTLFAPTNAAFDKLDPALVEALLANPDKLTEILTYHVLAGQALLAADLIGRDGLTEVTVNGETIAISVTDGNVFINGSQVIQADILATNGVAHAIDTVLIPANFVLDDKPTLNELIADDDRFDKLRKALQLTGLDKEIGNSEKPYTVLLPTDDAWHRLSSWKLHYLFKNSHESNKVLRKTLLNHFFIGESFDLQTLLAKQKVQSAGHLVWEIRKKADEVKWVFCSKEHEFCKFEGEREVKYGANHKYFYGTYTDGVACSNDVFGDPIKGTFKHCFTKQTIEGVTYISHGQVKQADIHLKGGRFAHVIGYFLH